MQEWIERWTTDLPAWLGPVAGFGGALVLAAIVHAIVYFVLKRVTKRTPGVADSSIVSRTRSAGLLLALVIGAHLALPALPLEDDAAVWARHGLWVLFIAALTWLAIASLGAIRDIIAERYDIDVSDNLRARRVQTQTRVLIRVASIVIFVIGAAAALMTFDRVREVGASLLVSAGAAGIVVGLAARPTIANLLAGVQIALTEPIRLDDVVIVEGEWGRIEEIRSTYVVVRIWDERRLIVPLERFIDTSFQNWTRTTAQLLGTVFLYTDYTVDVDAIRAELKRLCEASEKWDGRVCVVQVTDATESTVQVRALVSAANSGNLWDLRVHVREKLIEYLQREQPEALPRNRAEIAEPVRLEGPSLEAIGRSRESPGEGTRDSGQASGGKPD